MDNGYNERVANLSSNFESILKGEPNVQQVEKGQEAEVKQPEEQPEIPSQQNAEVAPENVAKEHQQEQTKESVAELIAKMGRKDKQYRDTLAAIRNENQQLKDSISQLRSSQENWDQDILSKIKQRPDIYQKLSEELLPQIAKDSDPEEQKRKAEEEYRKKIDELEQKLIDFQQETKYNEVINYLSKGVTEAMKQGDYTVQSEFYGLLGKDIVTESLLAADAYAGQFKQRITPEKALMEAVQAANEDIDKWKAFFQKHFFSTSNSKVDVKPAVSEGAKNETKEIKQEIVQPTIPGTLAPPHAAGSKLSYEDRLKSLQSNLDAILSQYK